METILIVEDNTDISNMIADALNKNGYLCVQAFSGTEALLRIEQSRYDLILLDLMLPGMSGEEFIRKIKPSNQTPVIIVSAKDELTAIQSFKMTVMSLKSCSLILINCFVTRFFLFTMILRKRISSLIFR